MDKNLLREKNSHGTPELPIGFHRMEQAAGQAILDVHWHEEAEFLWVEDGCASFMVGGSTYNVEKGEAVFVPPGELHGGFSLHGAACTYQAIVFDLLWLTSPNDSISGRFLFPLERGEVALTTFVTSRERFGRNVVHRLRRLYRLGQRSHDFAKAWLIKAELYRIFAEYISGQRWTRTGPGEKIDAAIMHRFKSVLSYVEEFHMKKLTVGHLAGIANMSEGHFSRVFKAQMRRTPMEHLNHFRIQKAASLLVRTADPVGDIAAAVGFEHFSYFIKRFRDVYGCAPTQYRKRLASGNSGS